MAHTKTVAKYIRRSPYQAVSAGMIMTLTFFTISIFIVATLISIRLIHYVETRPELTVFFKDTATQSQMDDLKNQLLATGKVTDMKFVSKEQAVSIYKQMNQGEDPILNDLVTSDILPASYDVRAATPQDLESLLPVVQKSSIVQEVSLQKDILQNLTSWTGALRRVGLVIISVLLLVSIFVILTIIGIKITVRRSEIETMRLMGASSWFIRAPFLLEGIFYGFVGAVVGWGMTYGLLWYSQPALTNFFKGVPVFSLDPILMLEIFGLEVIIACFLGAFASYLAVLRYLK